jgi:chemotaxis protein CheC
MNPSPNQLDALKEMINIGVGRGAGVLNTLLQAHISLEIPAVHTITPSELPGILESGDPGLCLVTMPFAGPLEGEATMVFSCENAGKLVGVLTGHPKEPVSIDTLEAGTVSEVGNIVLNGVMGTVGNILGLCLTYQVPGFRQGDSSLLQQQRNEDGFRAVLANTRFRVEKLEMDGLLVLRFAERSFGLLLDRIDNLILEEV